MRARVAWWIFGSLTSACGDDGGEAIHDASSIPPNVAPEARVVAPEPTIAPSLPDLGECPTGWIERRTEGGLRYCDPFPSGMPACDGAEILAPGSSGCTPLAQRCPAGEWIFEEPLFPPPAMVYVRLGASGGDGSLERPLGSLVDAIAIAESGSTIVLARGEYRETVLVQRPTTPESVPSMTLSIAGACAEQTHLIGGSTVDAALTIDGSIRVSVSGLHVSNPNGVAIHAIDGASVSLNHDRLGPASRGIVAFRSSLAIYGSVLRDLRVRAVDLDRSDCDMFSVELDRAGESLRASSSESTLTDVLMRAASESPIALVGGSTLTADRIAVAGPRGIIVRGSVARFSQTFVDGSHAGGGMSLDEDADVLVERSTFVATAGIGPNVHDAELTLRDVIVSDVSPDDTHPDTPIAVGISASDATLRLERTAVEGVAGLALHAQGSLVRGNDVSVEATVRFMGTGLCFLGTGSDIDLRRVRVTHCGAAGLALSEEAHAVIDDLTVEDVGDGLGPSFGVGLFSGSELLVHRAAIDRAQMIAISVAGASARLRGSDLVVRDVLPLPPDLDYGRGIEATNAADVALRRIAVARAHDHGVLALDGAHVTLEDLRVAEVATRACETEECEEAPAGLGVAAYRAQLSVSHFEIVGAALCGAHRAADATLELSSGVIEHSAVGLCIAGGVTEGLDRDVVYRDNGENLNARELPVPSPAPPVLLAD